MERYCVRYRGSLETRNQVLATTGRPATAAKFAAPSQNWRGQLRRVLRPDSLGILLILTVLRASAATLPRNLSRPRKLCSDAVNNRQILRRLNVATPAMATLFERYAESLEALCKNRFLRSLIHEGTLFPPLSIYHCDSSKTEVQRSSREMLYLPS